jgi:hypothetical protein
MFAGVVRVCLLRLLGYVGRADLQVAAGVAVLRVAACAACG